MKFIASILLSSFLVLPAAAQDGAGNSPHARARAFLDALDEAQRAKATFDYDAEERTDWHYIPKPVRKGADLRALNPAQREAALALLATSLSKAGYEKATAAMELEGILRLLEKDAERRDPDKYFVSVFGEPGPTGTWGYSFEGHHLSLNFTYRDGALACATPLFYGGNPDKVIRTAEGLPPVGFRALAEESDLALALVRSLDADQAVLGEPDRDMKEGGQAQAQERRRVGVAYTDLDAGQRKQLWALIDCYLGNLPADEYAAGFRAGIEQEQDAITFGWHGATRADRPHRYQVVGPGFAIVYYNTQKDSIGTAANHSHAILRTIGGDFGLVEE